MNACWAGDNLFFLDSRDISSAFRQIVESGVRLIVTVPLKKPWSIALGRWKDGDLADALWLFVTDGPLTECSARRWVIPLI